MKKYHTSINYLAILLNSNKRPLKVSRFHRIYNRVNGK